MCCSLKQQNAGTKAVILFAGGNGTPITIPEGQGIRFSGNFLVRSSAFFANDGFITAIVDAPSDKPEGPLGGRDGGMSNAFRQSSMHLTDIRAVVDFLVNEGATEVFLIGTSRGTLSVAYLATVVTHANVEGYVLTASLAESPPAIRSYAPRITDPVLMVHHTGDVCRVTRYDDALAIYETIPASPRNGFITVSGGSSPIDDNPCQSRTAHGFLGKERETVGGDRRVAEHGDGHGHEPAHGRRRALAAQGVARALRAHGGGTRHRSHRRSAARSAKLAPDPGRSGYPLGRLPPPPGGRRFRRALYGGSAR